MEYSELDERPISKFILYATILVGLGSFLDGYDLLNISIALPFITRTMTIAASMQGMLGTGTYLGGVAGAALFGIFSDLRGRKTALIVDLVFFMAASLISAVISSPAQLLVLRIAIGFGIGADIVSGPALLSELLPIKNRGKLLGTSLLMMPLGGLVSVVAAYFLYNLGIGAPLIWRVIFALGAIPAIIVIILRSRLPESPRWLSKFGNSIKPSKEFKSSTLSNYRHNYRLLAGKYKRALIYSSVAWFSAGTTSIFTIFSPMILEKFALKGYPQMIALTATIWIAATGGAAVAIALHDTVGRKSLLITSIILLGLSDLLLGLAFTSNGYIMEAVLACAMFFSFMNISAAYVIQTEVFSTEIKGLADGISFTINRLANFAFGISVPVLLALNIIKQFMWFTGIVVIAMAIIALITGIETMGKGLEKIQQEVMLS
ncbi:MAG: MFS transporter [Nitrososphaerota archaeon]|jgi:putative MFS transporter|nr:MFS transporter [Nitrososphaerota archaeon]MDG6927583.1 MFS transporter [Nitrososphaerota archaeon]MDG6930643.1 MFS transporter [Nitrososphaerota archaeon]MDG6932478.1 MFS transporter [Nitrososphaerota archaeon]MDG6936241.1 MFS transporter [Nitrososphaerota archaeon]